MKTLWKITGIGLISCCALVSILHAEGRRQYTFKDLKYSFQCPETWAVSKVDQGILKDVVTVTLPKNTRRRKFTATMVFVSSKLTDPSALLEDIYNLNLKNMASSPDFPDFKLMRSYNITLAGYDAYQATFKYRHPTLKVRLQSIQNYILANGRLYILQYAAPTTTYKKYMDQVNAAIESFRIL